MTKLEEIEHNAKMADLVDSNQVLWLVASVKCLIDALETYASVQYHDDPDIAIKALNKIKDLK